MLHITCLIADACLLGRAQLTTQAELDFQAANLTLVIDEIANSTDYFTDSDRIEALAVSSLVQLVSMRSTDSIVAQRLNELGEFNARLGAVDNATGRILDRSSSLAGWANDLYSWRNSYLSTRNNKYSEWIGTDDEFRLLVFDGFLCQLAAVIS